MSLKEKVLTVHWMETANEMPMLLEGNRSAVIKEDAEVLPVSDLLEWLKQKQKEAQSKVLTSVKAVPNNFNTGVLIGKRDAFNELIEELEK